MIDEPDPIVGDPDFRPAIAVDYVDCQGAGCVRRPCILHRVEDDLVADQAQRHSPRNLQHETHLEVGDQGYLSAVVNLDKRRGDILQSGTKVDTIKLG